MNKLFELIDMPENYRQMSTYEFIQFVASKWSDL